MGTMGDLSSINVAICGLGYWGPNLLRNLRANPAFRVVGVADRRQEAVEAVIESVSNLVVYDDAIEAIIDPNVHAVAIATPVSTHYDLTKLALERGKHVLVEKPLCTKVDQAQELVDIADHTGLTLMIDHTFLFHPCVRKLGTLVQSGSLGAISYYDSLRVNLGIFQPDVNVLWDLAPHDLSIIDFLFDEVPIHVEATGYCHLNPRLPDIGYVTLHFPSRMVAHLNLSWMSPIKVRRTAVGGSKKMVVWDDLDRNEPIRIYDSGISVLRDDDREVLIPGYRVGDVHAPRLPNDEALKGVVTHFERVIRMQEPSIMDGRRGLRMVRILDRVQRSLNASLSSVDAETAKYKSTINEFDRQSTEQKTL
jgi:predicted dehydrogenase